MTNYLPFALFPILYIGSKLYFRTPLVKLEEMDFVSGLKEIEADTYDEPPPRNWVERFWGWLVSAHLAARGLCDRRGADPRLFCVVDVMKAGVRHACYAHCYYNGVNPVVMGGMTVRARSILELPYCIVMYIFRIFSSSTSHECAKVVRAR